MNAMQYAEKAQDLFVLSDSFIRIKELIDSESSTIDDISDVILLDPALAGTILKLANSSFFNYPSKIDTISKAVLVLGITEVYNLVIAYFTTDAFKSLQAEQDYLDDFWLKSVDCALIVKYVGCHLKLPNAERLFILGLLHNLGELVVKQFSPKEIERCHQVGSDEHPWDVQRSVLGFTFGECSAELMKLWRLPYHLMEPIRFQDDEGNLQFASDETRLMYIAKRVMTMSNLFPNKPFSVMLNADHLTPLNIDERLLSQAISYCSLERLGILSILNPSATMIY